MKSLKLLIISLSLVSCGKPADIVVNSNLTLITACIYQRYQQTLILIPENYQVEENDYVYLKLRICTPEEIANIVTK
jgi:hypothetical protein